MKFPRANVYLISIEKAPAFRRVPFYETLTYFFNKYIRSINLNMTVY